jgi:uncharacterized protein (DUF952 family)
VALFHIVSRADWGRRSEGDYAPASLDREGFVHLSTEAQLLRTAQRFFSGRRDLLALVIAEDRLSAPVRYEPADGDSFPHLYGALNLDAVDDVAPLLPDEGGFTLLPGADGLALRLADAYAECPAVEAVALGGSRSGPLGADSASDVDLYVYSRGALSLEARALIAASHGAGADRELGNTFWEAGDEWEAHTPAVKVDVMMRDVAWTENEVARVLERHQASLGYSTCVVHNVANSVCLYDRRGWYAQLKTRAGGPYPIALRDAILAKNHPVLRNAHSSYLGQIRSAAARGDRVSVNHRVAALLASAFDVLFAANRMLHPGEKRLLQFVAERADQAPGGFAGDVAALIDAVGRPDEDVVARAERLVDAVDAWLESLGLVPPWPRRGGT